jgi:hypothetical protein
MIKYSDVLEYDFPQFIQFKTVSMIEDTVFIYTHEKLCTKKEGFEHEHYAFWNDETGQTLCISTRHLEYFYTGTYVNLN